MSKRTGKLILSEKSVMMVVSDRDVVTVSSAASESLTVEGLVALAQDFAAFLRLPYADPVMEARRVAGLDQMEASVRDMVEDAAKKIER